MSSSTPIEHQLVTWGLIILGWLIVILDQNRRAKRKDVRDLIDSAIELVDELEKASQTYWTQDEDMPECCALASDVKRGRGRLVRITNALKRNNAAFEVDDKIKIFMQAMTMGDFESKTRRAVPTTHQRVAAISAAALDITEHLEQTFQTHYCSWWSA